MILNRVTPLLEQHLIKEQLLNLTQHIEDGYQRGMITGETYDTVNHRILIQKLYNQWWDSAGS